MRREPEGHITVTTIYADTDFLLDQLFWQYSDLLRDRLEAQGFADTIYTDPAQVLRLGEDRSGMLMPWLDELVALSVDGVYRERFHRMQALWFSVMDQVAPFIRISPYRTSPHQRARIRPCLPRDRRFTPPRAEARKCAMLYARCDARLGVAGAREDGASVYQAAQPRVRRCLWEDSVGVSDDALRVQEMAHLPRESDLSVAEAGRRVGWKSRNRAATAFQQGVGVTPSRYRAMGIVDARTPSIETSVPS